jgi:hypothetical protein
MNIYCVSLYLKIGYRVRRSSWEPEEYLYEIAGLLNKKEIDISRVYDDELQTPVEYRRLVDIFDPLQLQDLLAEDWEIITTGLRKDFNKFGAIEYNDEPDWETWKPDYSWFD